MSLKTVRRGLEISDHYKIYIFLNEIRAEPHILLKKKEDVQLKEL